MIPKKARVLILRKSEFEHQTFFVQRKLTVIVEKKPESEKLVKIGGTRLSLPKFKKVNNLCQLFREIANNLDLINQVQHIFNLELRTKPFHRPYVFMNFDKKCSKNIVDGLSDAEFFAPSYSISAA